MVGGKKIHHRPFFFDLTGWSEPVAQAGLELVIFLPRPPDRLDHRDMPQHSAKLTS